MPVLHVPSMAGGVVLTGSSDAQASNELQQCDGFDLGLRGQLAFAKTAQNYFVLNDLQGTPQPQAPLYALGAVQYGSTTPFAVTVGLGKDVGGNPRYFFSQVAVDAGVALVPSLIQTAAIAGFTPPTDPLAPLTITRKPQVTYASFPWVNASGVQTQAYFVNVGSRAYRANAGDMPGLYVLIYTGTYNFYPISQFCALGTGTYGSYTGNPGDSALVGTHGTQLKFRGIAMYNNMLFGWGFDNTESTGEGPTRLMFSNLGNPFAWGNDNQAAVGSDRVFADTDAITVGGAGESITGCLASRGKLFIGTNRGLHHLQGYGRDSIQTDGLTGIASSLDVAGPYGLVEGPDGMLYGLSSRGLWRLNTTSYFAAPVEHLYQKLVKYDGSSPGYWDLLAPPGPAPSTGNLDLAWLLSDPVRGQVWIVIPGCDATAGSGAGSDTVIIKYHIAGGGFTRQVLPGVIWYKGTALLRGSAARDHFLIPESAGGQIVDYGTGSTGTGSITFGEYAPFGPDGEGVCRVCYLVLSWLPTSLPITGTVTPSVDQRTFPTVNLTVSPTQPVSPSDGDLWVDTSGTDTNLGNATSGSIVVALNDYLVKTWKASWNKWVIIPRSGGAKGSRNGIPIAFTAQKGTRVKIALTLNASDDVQVEGLGLEPSLIRDAA